MKLEEMSLDELKAYRASVEVYGTPAELVEVTQLIQEAEGK